MTATGFELTTTYHYCTTSFYKAWTQVLHRFKSCLRRVGDSRWWGSLTTVPAGNKAKRLSSVNHTTTTIHHHQQALNHLPRLANSNKNYCYCKNTILKVPVMQTERALINDRLHISKVSWKFRIPNIYHLAVIEPVSLLPNSFYYLFCL